MKKTAMILISLLLAGCVSNNVNSPPVETDLTIKIDESEIEQGINENYVLGDTVILFDDNVKITVFEGQTEIDEFSVNYAKERGEKHVSYEILIESGEMSQNFSVNPLFFVLKDINGYTYDPAYDGNQLLKSGDLSPNSRTRGFITFRVPEGTIPWQVIYNDYSYQVIWELSSPEETSSMQI